MLAHTSSQQKATRENNNIQIWNIGSFIFDTQATESL